MENLEKRKQKEQLQEVYDVQRSKIENYQQLIDEGLYRYRQETEVLAEKYRHYMKNDATNFSIYEQQLLEFESNLRFEANQQNQRLEAARYELNRQFNIELDNLEY